MRNSFDMNMIYISPQGFEKENFGIILPCGTGNATIFISRCRLLVAHSYIPIC